MKHYLLQFFELDGIIGEAERSLAANYRNMARIIQSNLEYGSIKSGSEATTALRKLLESRDAALRAAKQEE